LHFGLEVGKHVKNRLSAICGDFAQLPEKPAFFRSVIAAACHPLKLPVKVGSIPAGRKCLTALETEGR